MCTQNSVTSVVCARAERRCPCPLSLLFCSVLFCFLFSPLLSSLLLDPTHPSPDSFPPSLRSLLIYSFLLLPCFSKYLTLPPSVYCDDVTLPTQPSSPIYETHALYGLQLTGAVYSRISSHVLGDWNACGKVSEETVRGEGVTERGGCQ